ncbi:MAG: site-2 protease family protein [Candidatus Zixiibacteriota bacterium]|nr:MAG: site-2 protease family protein [candidate division Zixibacteria bacterium]
MKNQDVLSRTLYYQMADLFEITAIYSHNERLFFRARPYQNKEEAVGKMKRRLESSGFAAAVREDPEGLLIGVWEKPSRKIPRLNIILFAATLVTMFIAPVFWINDIDVLLRPASILEYLGRPGILGERVEFTVALISILLFHEFGHYLAGKRRGVLMSLPYFVPAPNIAGTFGAIIRSRSPITNRRDLIEIGSAGPIAGFVISVIALSIGLYNSEIIPVEAAAGFALGDSLLIRFLSWLIVGPLPDGSTFLLSPAAFAGWVGLLVTMLNLLPLGQLDGGHIIYGLFGRRQHRVSKVFLAIMIALGFWWPGWWFFGALVFLFGISHPPTLDETIKPTRPARALGLISIIIFIISFIPVPFALA